MPPRSKVLTLPPEIKEWLDATLVETNFSGYALIEEELAKRGFRISKSSLNRYGKEFEDELAALRVATDQARAVVEAAPDEEGALNEALMRLVQRHLFQLLRSEDGEYDLTKVAKAVAELGRASVVQKKWQSEVRARAEAAAANVEKIAKKGGLSADSVAQLRREILGIAQ